LEEFDRSVLKTAHQKDIEFHAGIFSESYKIACPAYLYNTAEFIKISSGKEPVVFSIIDKRRKTILVQCKFTIRDGVAYSPEIGPFGSLEMDPSLPSEILIDFVRYIERTLADMEVNQVIIKNYATFQSASNCKKIHEAFLEGGYTIHSVNINHHIDVSDRIFSSFIHSMEKRRMEKANKADLVVRRANLKEMGRIHDFIRECRNEKGLEINISKEKFLETIDQLSEHYYAFIGIIDGTIAVASVCVRVNSDILYNYLPASAGKYNSLSPMVKLMGYIYNFAQDMNFKFIDLGVSSISGKPQESLIKFKERIGGQMSEKITYRKSLND